MVKGLFLAVLLSGGCASQCAADSKSGVAPQSHTFPSAGPSVKVSTEDYTSQSGTAVRLYRWSFDLNHTGVELRAASLPGTLHEVLDKSAGALAINAGFFGLRGEVVGLAVSNHEVLSTLDEALGGGVLSITKNRAVLYEAERFQLAEHTDLAVQCRPRLIVDGKINIRKNDGKRADRTALCVLANGQMLDVFLARTADPTGMSGPTLKEFATWLHSKGCEQALNLDGGPSTGAVWRSGRQGYALYPRGPIVQSIVFIPNTN